MGIKLDWPDIALHIAVAAALMLLPPIFVNTVFWPARELLQHRPDYHEIITRPQPLLEWLCPVITGFIIWGLT